MNRPQQMAHDVACDAGPRVIVVVGLALATSFLVPRLVDAELRAVASPSGTGRT